MIRGETGVVAKDMWRTYSLLSPPYRLTSSYLTDTYTVVLLDDMTAVERDLTRCL